MKLNLIISTCISILCQIPFIFAQAPDDITKRTYEAAGWTYSELDSQYIEYQSFEEVISPDEKYKLLIRHVGLSDVVKKSQYHLVRFEEEDTTFLMDSYRHDGPSANFYWTNNHHLLYEKNDDGGDGEIIVWSLLSNKKVFSTIGLIFAQNSQRRHYFDNKNNILFYFTEAYGKSDLKTLDLNSFEMKKVKSLSFISWDNWPLISHDKTKRTVIVKHWKFTNESSKEITESFPY